MESKHRHLLSPGALFGVFCILVLVVAPIVVDIDRLDGA